MRCYCTYIVSGSSQAIPAEFSSFCMETINSNSPNRMCCNCNVMVVHWAAFVWLGFGLWRVWMKCVRLILFRFAEVASNRKYINYLHKCKKKRKRRKMEIYLTKRQTDGSFIIIRMYVCTYIYKYITNFPINFLFFHIQSIFFQFKMMRCQLIPPRHTPRSIMEYQNMMFHFVIHMFILCKTNNIASATETRRKTNFTHHLPLIHI